jgi:hypothetical protein
MLISKRPGKWINSKKSSFYLGLITLKMQEIQFISEILHFGLQNQAVISTLGIKYSILNVNLLSVKFVTLT